jgi:N-acetyl-anhydromuramyl-L-alanine amidase AmpD
MDTTYTGSLDAATNCFECPDNPSSFQPEFIVYHMTDGESFGGAASFDQDGDGTPDGSTNYIIDKDGTIYELVPPGSAMPWANGQTEGAGVITKEQLRAAAEADNLNNRSISIEMVGAIDTGTDRRRPSTDRTPFRAVRNSYG